MKMYLVRQFNFFVNGYSVLVYEKSINLTRQRYITKLRLNAIYILSLIEVK